MNLSLYRDSKNKLISGDYSVESYFIQNNFVLEYAYCKLLSGDLITAQKEFASISKIDFRANWAEKLIGIITSSVVKAPSYFQIRNFLEIDLNLLLGAGQAEFVEEIINKSDLLYSINPESFKFIARVMLNNQFNDVAMFYLHKAKNHFYKDPEMHLMLANCYLHAGSKKLAIDSINNCLRLLPEYEPAKKLLLTLI